MREIVARLKKQWGTYCWWEFEDFATDRGIRVRYHGRDDLPRAFHRGRTVYLRYYRSQLLLARGAWHEFGHIISFPLNAEHWDKVSWGDIVIAKTEGRCTEWSMQFPDWDADLPPARATQLRPVVVETLPAGDDDDLDFWDRPESKRFVRLI